MTERPSERAVAAAMDAFDASRKQYHNMFDMGAVLRAAYAVDFPAREEGDADVQGAGRCRWFQAGPDVAPLAVGPDNSAAGQVAHVLEIVLREMTRISCDLATEWANTSPDGTKIHGFDMDRWREGFREGLRRAAEEADKV